MNYTLLLEKARQYVLNFLIQEKEGAYCFHDNVHTDDVVAATTEMATHYNLNEEDRFATVCAAYFHDIGYCNQQGADRHESRSAELADIFLKEHNVTETVRQKVKGCIMATRMPQSPTNILEEIVCDADLFHWGSGAFDQRNQLMHQEAEQVANFKIPKSVWRPLTIQLLKEHKYHTDYAKNKLDKEKLKNINDLEKEEEKYRAKKAKSDSVKKRPNRGIETMFRVSTTNSQRLSDMADNKANILLTVNSIILSVLVAVLIEKLDSSQHLIFPTVMLLVTVVATMVLAILSTIPKVSNGRFKPEDVENKNVNLLFFGNFHQMSYNTYEEAMKTAMGDYDFLYSMLTRDVYSQGVVLGRKYKLLRYAYGIFMIGLIVSVCAFIVALAFVI